MWKSKKCGQHQRSRLLKGILNNHIIEYQFKSKSFLTECTKTQFETLLKNLQVIFILKKIRFCVEKY
jgi:hypothetical protein